MKKKKIILIVILSLITLLLAGLIVYREINDTEEKIVQSNERNDSLEQIKIVNDYINIRNVNDSQAELLGKVYKDEIYTVLEKLEDEYYVWCKIETSNGINGYVAVKYLEEEYVEFLEIVEVEEEIVE